MRARLEWLGDGQRGWRFNDFWLWDGVRWVYLCRGPVHEERGASGLRDKLVDDCGMRRDGFWIGVQEYGFSEQFGWRERFFFMTPPGENVAG